MKQKILKVATQNSTGLNTEFINLNSNRTIPLEQVIGQIEKGNPTYSGYHISQTEEGTKYVRSNPNGSSKDNIE